MSSAPKRTHIRREAQEVPVPSWVSPGLLAMHENPELRYRPIANMPTTSDGWKKLIAAIEKQNAEDPANSGLDGLWVEIDAA